MARPPRRQAGFTLVELIVVTLISGLMFVSLAAFYASGVRFQIQTFNRLVIQNRALYALKHMQMTVEQATVLVSPPPGGTTAALDGAINQRPDEAVQTPLVVGVPVRSFYYCVSQNCPVAAGFAPRCLWYYTWTSFPRPAVNCGLTPGGEVLASPVTTALPFNRPLSPTNLVRVNMEVLKPATSMAQEAKSTVTVDLRARLATQ